MGRGLKVALGLAMLAQSASAGDLGQYARFVTLHGASEAYEVAADQLRGGLGISGEKITLDNGNFTATVQKVTHAAFVMTGVSAQGRMPLDDAFFADPITAAMNNVLNGSTVGIAEFKNLVQGPEPVDIPIKDVKITMAQKAVTGSLKALVFKPEFKAHASYDKASKKMTMTLESVTMGGVAVPLDLTFYVISQVLHYPFVTLANPNVVVDLTPFLPNMGLAPVVP